MTNEQEEAIKYLKESVLIYKNTIPKMSNTIDTVLSLIKENQIEIDKYKTLYDRALSDVVKADKQIDLMAETISNNIAITYFNDTENVKKYYEKLAERKVEDVKD